MAAMMRYLGINVLFTLYPEDKIAKVWDQTRLPNVAVFTTLAGYVPDSLLNLETTPIATRPIDIGYRGRALPYWLGRLGQEKVWIAQGVLERAPYYGLCCDIGWLEEDRIYGEQWNVFIRSCKAMLGTESGASITDFDGSIQARVNEYMTSHPDADFFAVQRAVLMPYENNLVINVISPRMFEAIALRTALIMFPGHYSGLLQPWVHYIPLEKDFSNMDQVVEKLRDLEYLQTITQRAYTDLVASGHYSYRRFIQEFDRIIEEQMQGRLVRRSTKFRYWLAQLERIVVHVTAKKPVHPLNYTARTDHFYTIFLVAYYMKLLPWLLLILTLRDPLPFRLLRACLGKLQRQQGITIGILIADLLRLGIIRKIQKGGQIAPGSVQILAQIEAGHVLFTSTCGNHEGTPLESVTHATESGAFWLAFESAWRTGQIKKIVWDHTACQAILRYRLGRFVALPWKVIDGLYTFNALIQLAPKSRENQ